MIRDVRLDGWTPNDIPWKFEAGTPPIVEAVGLHAAIEDLESVGMDAVREHEVSLTGYALRTLTERFGDDITHPRPGRAGAAGRRASPSTSATSTPTTSPRSSTSTGVCVRAGHHCAKPLMRRLGVGATARASLYVYNDEADVDALADALEATSSFFA